MINEDLKKENKKTLLFVMSTQYERDTVGRILKRRNELKEIDKKYSLSSSELKEPQLLEVALTFKSIWEVIPGEQDLLLAGGRNEDEEYVRKMKGSGQIIVRYSQLGCKTPYSGKSVEELGYSFMIEKGRGSLSALIYNREFLEGLLVRDSKMWNNSLAYNGVYPTGYLKECCAIPVKPVPTKFILEAIANENKVIDEMEQSGTRAYYSSGKVNHGGGCFPVGF